MATKKRTILENNQNCFVCGSPYVQIHHCIHGTANRKIADKYGLIVPLCYEHHLGQTGVHHKPEFDLELKQMAQRFYEENYGTREDFIKDFGKSWILEDDDE